MLLSYPTVMLNKATVILKKIIAICGMHRLIYKIFYQLRCRSLSLSLSPSLSLSLHNYGTRKHSLRCQESFAFDLDRAFA